LFIDLLHFSPFFGFVFQIFFVYSKVNEMVGGKKRVTKIMEVKKILTEDQINKKN
jgi:hypothetical protein